MWNIYWLQEFFTPIVMLLETSTRCCLSNTHSPGAFERRKNCCPGTQLSSSGSSQNLCNILESQKRFQGKELSSSASSSLAPLCFTKVSFTYDRLNATETSFSVRFFETPMNTFASFKLLPLGFFVGWNESWQKIALQLVNPHKLFPQLD